MKFSLIAGALPFALVVCSPFASAQRPGLEIPILTPGPGWKTCPRCENDAHIDDAREKANVDTRPFNSHDLTGVWDDLAKDEVKSSKSNGPSGLDTRTVPTLTPYGQKLHDDTKSTVGPDGVVEANAKDPMVICDPLGFPRQFAYNYGMEFIQLPDRVLQFFEWGHMWRTIWTDGRKLPDDPPLRRFEGYAVGHWEKDTFVVESSGYDDKSWLSSDGDLYGFGHTADMRVEERYERINYGKLRGSVTVTDPKVYTKPWTTSGIFLLIPNAEIGEYMCLPSDSAKFNERQTAPSVGLTSH
jgi:hypothetical protein